MNMVKLNTLLLVKTTVGIWATLIKGTQWQTATQFVAKTEADNNYFFISWIILNSYIILSFCGSRTEHSFIWLWFGFWK
jgi:hypothetical protein